MANLETLELTINANAESASKGLSNLISSLSALSKKINEAFNGLTRLNAEIRRLNGNSINFQMPNVGATSGAKTASRASGNYTLKPMKLSQQLPAGTNSIMVNGQQMKVGTPQEFAQMNQNGKLAQGIARSYNEVAQSASKASKGNKGFLSGLKGLGKDIKSILPKFHLLNRVMRIASTMLIRMGVKALFKGAKEGFNNFYEYSKATGGAFAKQMDGVYSSWNQIKNQMGASLATVFSAALPVINSLASAAITAFNYLSQLIALLTGKSSWSRATEQVSNYGDAINKANGSGGSGGMKELLANFDELNVIAQESGGGGGGAASAAADVAEMFEEVTEFDTKIREIAEFIRGLIDWVKENLDLVLTAVGLIGLAILGWKISEAFDGALSTLGKLLAGGALVALGVVLEFDFGKKLGAYLAGGKALTWADLAEGIVGIIAAGIGGFVIGGGLGAAVGITIALTATIGGIIVGWNDEKDKQKWGKNSLTPEQVEAYVKKQFTFDIEIETKIVNEKISNARAAKAHLDREIYEFSESLYKIKINVDNSEIAIADAKDKLLNVIDALKETTTENENLLIAYFKVMPYDETKENGTLKNITSANRQLNEYFENEGKKVADLYDKGMRTGWTENEQEQILALMEHNRAIFEGAENESITTDYILGSKVVLSDANLANVTRESAKEVFDSQRKRIKEFKNAMKDATVEHSSEDLYLAGIADRAGLIDEESGRPLGDIYRDAADFIVDGFDEAMEEKLAESNEIIKKDWIESLQQVYSHDYGREIMSKSKKNFINQLTNTFRKNGQKDAEVYVQEFIYSITQNDEMTKGASELFGITGWDLLAQEQREQFVQNVYQAVGMDGVSILKNSLKLSADEIVMISGWSAFSTEQKIDFVNALVDAYGSTEAITAAKKAGIDIQKAIDEGLSSDNENTRKAAQKLRDTIGNELSNIHVEISIDAVINVVTKVVNGVGNAALQVLNNVAKIKTNAAGAYNIPNGDLFIANEAGAELVGSIGGKTSVANQGQIIEGIQRGVSEANSEQNTLLRRQNELLQQILEKDASVRIGASAALGRVARQSLDMYGSMVGG